MFVYADRIPGAFAGRIRRLAVTAAVVVASGTVVAGSALANGEKLWNVQSVTGSVQVKTADGKWQPVQAGAKIVSGSVIRTGEAGRAVVARKGDVVEAAPGSEAAFPEQASKTMPSVVQNAGTLIYKIVTRPADRFNVKTPYLTAVIKGTVFSVTVNDQGGALHVTRGAVEVTSRLTGEIAMVRPGQTAAISTRPGIRLKLMGGPKSNDSAPKDKGAKSIGQPASDSVASGNGRNKGNALGLKKSVGVARLDVFKTSKGLIKGPRNGAAQFDRGAKPDAGRSGNKTRFDVPSVSKGLRTAQGNGGGAPGGGNGNGGGNGGGGGAPGGGNGNGGGNGGGAPGGGNGNGGGAPGGGNGNGGGNGGGAPGGGNGNGGGNGGGAPGGGNGNGNGGGNGKGN